MAFYVIGWDNIYMSLAILGSQLDKLHILCKFSRLPTEEVNKPRVFSFVLFAPVKSQIVNTFDCMVSVTSPQSDGDH